MNGVTSTQRLQRARGEGAQCPNMGAPGLTGLTGVRRPPPANEGAGLTGLTGVRRPPPANEGAGLTGLTGVRRPPPANEGAGLTGLTGVRRPPPANEGAGLTGLTGVRRPPPANEGAGLTGLTGAGLTGAPAPVRPTGCTHCKAMQAQARYVHPYGMQGRVRRSVGREGLPSRTGLKGPQTASKARALR